MVNHSGQIDSGHYVSMIQGSEGNWYVINDAKIMQVSVSQVGFRSDDDD